MSRIIGWFWAISFVVVFILTFYYIGTFFRP